jgi:F-type H+-transporting ATPase subunit c
MSRCSKWALPAVLLAASCAAAMAQDAKDAPGKGVAVKNSDPAVAMLGAALGAGVIIIGAGLGIGLIGSRVTAAIARQPEAAGSMFMPWLLTAAMIEGATLFGLLICFLIMQTAGKVL